jgi:peptidoglycan hydrolase-like protein with peptidoglycan-binding domain
MTPELVASLQRALLARGYYRGQTTGELDARTLRAVKAYQVDQGLESKILSVAALRSLGLWAVERDPLPPQES